MRHQEKIAPRIGVIAFDHARIALDAGKYVLAEIGFIGHDREARPAAARKRGLIIGKRQQAVMAVVAAAHV